MKMSIGPSADDFINLVLHSRLTDRQLEVVILRFGLDGKPPMTYEQIGAKVGLTRGRIGQILERARCEIRRSPSAMRLLKASLECYIHRDRRWAICKNRPPEWCTCKYHGWSEE